MKQTSIFKLIHTLDKINNDDIMQFTKAYQYPLGVSPILVLNELRLNGPKRQVELAEAVGYTKGAMTNIAAKLIHLGLVKKTADENDRRSARMEITAAGEKALIEAHEIGKRLFMQHFEVLTDDEVDQYLAIQEKLLTNIQNRRNKGENPIN